jgi:hypothetical protein
MHLRQERMYHGFTMQLMYHRFAHRKQHSYCCVSAVVVVVVVVVFCLQE